MRSLRSRNCCLGRLTWCLSPSLKSVTSDTYSNGLKDIGKHLGFRWSDSEAFGANTLVWRSAWELSRDPALQERSITLQRGRLRGDQVVAEQIAGLCSGDLWRNPGGFITNVESMKQSYRPRFCELTYAIPTFSPSTKQPTGIIQRSRNSPPVLKAKRTFRAVAAATFLQASSWVAINRWSQVPRNARLPVRSVARGRSTRTGSGANW